jgi:hypothetical protein
MPWQRMDEFAITMEFARNEQWSITNIFGRRDLLSPFTIFNLLVRLLFRSDKTEKQKTVNPSNIPPR